MDLIVQPETESTILVQLHTGRRSDEQARLEEFKQLAESAGLTVKAVVVQNRETPDARWLIGKGKAQELRQEVERLEVDTVVFGCELTPAQVRNLEQMIPAKILDRTQLILDIFAQRARTKEGQIQVELAQLNYILPRLSGHGAHLSRLGGGIGTRGPGETQLETDRRHIRRRIADLKARLQEIVRHRTIYRERRKKQGVYQAALVGYTNAGKSTLLGKLTGADAFAEDRVFATLDPTSRILILPSGNHVVLTDTVGFIQDLPHELVAAFRATLEEVLEADLIIHVVDAASPIREQQIAVVDRVLTELGASAKETLLVYNKADLLPERSRESEERALWISAFLTEDLDRLKIQIQNRLLHQISTFKVPIAKGDVIAQIHELGEILDRQIDDEVETMKITARIHPSAYERMKRELGPYKESDLQ